MEVSAENFKFISPSEYNPYKRVRVVFYNITDNVTKFLLYKNDRHFKELKSEKADFEPTAIFTASRIILNDLRGTLFKKNIDALVQKQPLDNSAILKEDQLWIQIWKNPLYFEWMGHLVQNKVQYDTIYETLVLFVELPYFDVTELNALAKANETQLEYQWFDFKELKENELVCPSLKHLASHVNFTEHINATLKNTNQDLYIVMACKPIDKSRTDTLYLHFPALLQGQYKRNNEEWIHMNTAEGNLPTEEQLSRAKAVICPGSSSNVYLDEPWLKTTLEWVKNFDAKFPKVKFLGVCFGAQLLCEALDGKVDMMEERKKDKKFFVAGAEIVKMEKEFFELPFAKASKVEATPELTILEAHGDLITKMPDNFVTYGTSIHCAEIFVSKDQRYFGIQGHPEYSGGQMSAWGAQFMAPQDKIESPQDFEDRRQNIIKNRYLGKTINEYEWRALCYYFLKHNSTDDITKSNPVSQPI
jgi:GMP synthase-like glutamine amidotransferase